MARIKNQGWYTYADGYRCWYRGLTATRRKCEERQHGKVVKFEPTYFD